MTREPGSRSEPRSSFHGRGFPAQARLKAPGEFQEVFGSGRKEAGRYFVIFSRVRPYGQGRLGLAVGRRVGGAVRRNLVKRLARESFRSHRQDLGAKDVVVVARASAGTASRQALLRDLDGCFRKVANG